MNKKSNDRIIILMPEKYKDREFAVHFDRHIDELKNCFIIDEKYLKPSYPVSGNGLMTMSIPIGGYVLKPKPIAKEV